MNVDVAGLSQQRKKDLGFSCWNRDGEFDQRALKQAGDFREPEKRKAPPAGTGDAVRPWAARECLRESFFHIPELGMWLITGRFNV